MTVPAIPATSAVTPGMFGNADPNVDRATAERRARYRRSILDGAVDEARGLSASVGPADRRRLDELRIQRRLC